LNEPHIFSKYGGTRFITTIGCGAVSAMLCHLGDITSDDFVEITKWTVTVFIGGHAGQNAVSFISNRFGNKPQPNEGKQDDNRQY
jgi:hypothetical protein